MKVLSVISFQIAVFKLEDDYITARLDGGEVTPVDDNVIGLVLVLFTGLTFLAHFCGSEINRIGRKYGSRSDCCIR